MISLETYYLTGMPILLKDGLGTIHPFTIRYMIENNLDYGEFMRPFLIRKDLLEDMPDDIYDFDLFFITSNSEEMMENLVNSLKILYKTEDVKVMNTIKIILINNEIIIKKENFTYLADVILEMMYATRVKPKKRIQKYKNPQLQATWEKLQRYREKEEKKKELNMADIMNMLIHINSTFDYDKVLNLTYYQMMNSYLTLMRKDSYDEFVMYKTSGQFKIEKDVKHWTVESKIKKSAYSDEE